MSAQYYKALALHASKYAYFIESKLFLSVTNKLVSKDAISLRGPTFSLPELVSYRDWSNVNLKVTPAMIFEAVNSAFEDGKISVSSMESDVVTFSGLGEPLLQVDTVAESISMIKEKRHGVQFSIATTGLFIASDRSRVRYYYNVGIITHCLSRRR